MNYFDDYEEDYDYDDYDEDGGGSVESIDVKDFESGLVAMREHLGSYPGSVAFSLMMKNDDQLTVHNYRNQPCYGELRPYKKTHPDLLPEHQREVTKPSDLHDPFPDGNPVAVGIVLGTNTQTSIEDHNFFIELVTSKDSPWRNVLKDYELLMGDNKYTGLILKDTKIEPTVMINLFMFIRAMAFSYQFPHFNRLRKKFPHKNPLELLCISTRLGKHWQSPGEISFVEDMDYYISPAFNAKNFLNGVTENLTGGTFYDRYAYDRPRLHDVFGKTDKTWRARLKEIFGKTVKESDDEKLINTFMEMVG